jgi:hypothetical protein
MTITHRELLDTSIAQLETLVAFLRDQLGETGGSQQVRSDAMEAQACREVLLSLNALVRRVQVARCAQPAVRGLGELPRKVSSFTRYARARPNPG